MNTVPATITARQNFRSLHDTGTFIIPNPFDVGSACLLEGMGFAALATTSAGFAWSLGRPDGGVSRDELVAHVAAISSAVRIPLNVDAERCFADDTSGVVETINLLAEAGAAGISIEDWNPNSNSLDTLATAAARVEAAAAAAHRHDVLLTARCENHFRGITDFEDTLTRLRAYKNAGADVLFAPGIATSEAIEQVVAIGLPVNLILTPALSIPDLSALGVRRVSVGGSLAQFAYGGLVHSAQQLLDNGRFDASNSRIPGELMQQAFRPR
jgi:2-methylisocitrate lyase-like PEP mutase family enzyme